MCFDPPDPPDYGPIAEANMELGEEQLGIMRDQLDWAKKQGGELMDVISRAVDGALKTEQQTRKFAREQNERYKEVYQPLEDRFVKEAEGFDTRERRDREAGRAMSTVGQTFDAARETAQRRLESYGIDPSMLRAGALDSQSRIAEAEAKAQAGTDASRRVEDMGRALRADAINMGRGLPSMAAQSYGLSLQAGQGAAGAATSGAATASGMQTAPATWGAGAQAGYNATTGAMNAGYQNELAAYEAGSQWGLPGMIQTGLGYATGRMGYAEGGPVRPEHSPTGGAVKDDVPANLDVDEYVMPNDVVRWKGEEFFMKLTNKAREDMGAIPKEQAAA